VLICEHLRGHTDLLGPGGYGRAEFIVNALNIEDADGAPVRVLGRPVEA
jgi:kynurenine formamidase